VENFWKTRVDIQACTGYNSLFRPVLIVPSSKENTEKTILGRIRRTVGFYLAHGYILRPQFYARCPGPGFCFYSLVFCCPFPGEPKEYKFMD
jgi:hypothetical protein